MECLIVGLIKGRHEMPVDEFIFDGAVDNPLDFGAMREHIAKFLRTHVGIRQGYGSCPSQLEYGDILRYKGERRLVVYVTGLTAAVAALVGLCYEMGTPLSLMHYDTATDSYVPRMPLWT